MSRKIGCIAGDFPVGSLGFDIMLLEHTYLREYDTT